MIGYIKYKWTTLPSKKTKGHRCIRCKKVKKENKVFIHHVKKLRWHCCDLCGVGFGVTKYPDYTDELGNKADFVHDQAKPIKFKRLKCLVLVKEKLKI